VSERLYEGLPLRAGAEARVRAKVLSVRQEPAGSALTLDRTPFYPTGGGQPTDLGTLDGVSLREACEEEGAVVHYLEQSVDWEVGREVECQLDVPRRRDHMQQHSGQHLLSAHLVRAHGVETLSFHLGDEECTIDVAAEQLSPALLAQVEAACNASIQADLPVSASVVRGAEAEAVAETLRKRPDPKALGSERGLRVVQLGPDEAPLDRDACCGTHVAATGELGYLLLLGAARARKGQTRLRFVVGGRAVRAARERLDALQETCGVLTLGHRALRARAEGLLSQSKDQAKRLKQLEQAAAELAGATLARGEGPASCVHLWREGAAAFAANFARSFLAAAPARHLALLVPDGRLTALIALNEGVPGDLDAGALLRELLVPLGGKGGGNPSFARGTAPLPDDLDALRATWSERLERELG
jgi:alanyl-tRNA synthetase